MNAPIADVGIVDVTLSLRRAARRRAAAVLVAAGWDLDQIALALGVSQGAALELMPKRKPPE